MSICKLHTVMEEDVAWTRKWKTPAQMLVILAMTRLMSTYADRDGGEADVDIDAPAPVRVPIVASDQPTIAKEAGLHINTVKRAMKSLADDGVIIVKQKGNRIRRSIYELHLERAPYKGTVSPWAL